MKILVTGGTGYIGSHTIVELIKVGYDVTIIDNLSNSEISVLDGIKNITGKSPDFYKLNLADKQQTELFFQKNNNFDAIIHFAAYKAVGESVESPLMYYENNISTLINVLKGMQKYNIPNLVFSSSCTVYGQPKELPVTENSPIQKADSPYGNTKQIAEEIIIDTVKASANVKAIALRYFNPIGAHPSAEIGELPNGTPNNLVPFITQTAIGKRKELSVFGNDYSTPDGTAIRDYIHVCDLADAHISAVNRLTEVKENSHFETLNIGTGAGNSVLDIVKTFQRVNNLTLNYKITARRPGDIEQVWADTSIANSTLGWKTRRTLEDSLISAWAWEKRLQEKEEKFLVFILELHLRHLHDHHQLQNLLVRSYHSQMKFLTLDELLCAFEFCFQQQF